MLIQVGGLPRAESVRSEFWSHGLFCRVRTRRAHDNWGYVRLWHGHPWQNNEVALKFIAERRAMQCSRRPPSETVIDLAISEAWVVFRYASADIPLPRGYTIKPDRYWYRAAKNSTASGYSSVVVTMESMCCYLCRVLSKYTP